MKEEVNPEEFQEKMESEGEMEGEGEGEDDDQGNSGNLQDGGSMPEGGSQQIIKKRTHRKLDISNFIMKTYKILEVSLRIFRIKETAVLSNGQIKETVSSSKTKTSSPEKFCPSTSNTASSRPSSGSLTCMISIKFAKKNRSPSSNTNTSKKE